MINLQNGVRVWPSPEGTVYQICERCQRFVLPVGSRRVCVPCVDCGASVDSPCDWCEFCTGRPTRIPQ
jgi:hypothetical protein